MVDIEEEDRRLGTPHLKFQRQGPLAWCTIDRPHARNAMTPAMYFGIKRAVQIVNTDSKLEALIITGSGDTFTTGGDLAGRTEAGEEVPPLVDEELLPFLTIRDSRAPVIAAVNGLCLAGGMLIAMVADIAVASETAVFGLPELLRGIPEVTGAAVLPAHVGVAMARDLLLTGRTIDANEAVRIGAISRVVAPEELAQEAIDAARQVLRTAPDARVHLKRVLNARYGEIDYLTQYWALHHSPEPQEGMRAFVEKRPPSWVPQDL